MIPDLQVLRNRIYIYAIAIAVKNQLKHVTVPGTFPRDFPTHYMSSIRFKAESRYDRQEKYSNHIIYNVKTCFLVYFRLFCGRIYCKLIISYMKKFNSSNCKKLLTSHSTF